MTFTRLGADGGRDQILGTWRYVRHTNCIKEDAVHDRDAANMQATIALFAYDLLESNMSVRARD